MSEFGVKTQMVSPEEEDHLVEDPPNRGQQFVLVSMLDARSVADSKEVFYFNEFLRAFRNNITELFDQMKIQYPEKRGTFEQIEENYSYIFDYDELQDEYKRFRNQEDLEEAFEKMYPNKGATRSGVKVRYVTDSQDDAHKKANELIEHEPNISINLGRVGFWLPFAPDENRVQGYEYQNTQLNTLMKEYQKSQEQRKKAFQERKERIKNRQAPVSSTTENPDEETEEPEAPSVSDVAKSIF